MDLSHVVLSFWGKMLGIYRDYYVIETEFQDGDYESITGSEDEAEVNRKDSVGSAGSDTVSKVGHSSYYYFLAVAYLANALASRGT